MVRAQAGFFARAYGTPIDCLVILLEPCNLLAGALPSGRRIASSGPADDHPGDASNLRGIDVHQPISGSIQMGNAESRPVDQEPSDVPVLGILGATLPLALTIALTALELLVAALQAYVFAILTCIYLNDALHPGH
jgi:hypothetical protein